MIYNTPKYFKMKKNIILFVLFALLFTPIDIIAENRLFVASTSTTYPYQRGRWTTAQVKAWMNKYGPIIGVNHPQNPCSAVTQEEAIKKAHELGFNSVRIFLGGRSASSYIDNVETWAAMCAKYDMTLSPVFGFVYDNINSSNKDSALAVIESIVRPTIQHFRNDERIILWDIWNEPEYSNATMSALQMNWISQIVKWCRQEGCTQPITSSIVWDASISAASNTSATTQSRNAVEALMDLHNFHDYAASEDFNNNISVMVNRFAKIDDRPLVCTECMIRTNGSTLARTLHEFEKYHIGFYSWGLYACDANWEVKWGRSTYYNYEPMFHNLLFMDGEPYDVRDSILIKNFAFSPDSSQTDPGSEWTENWTERRAWKWMTGKAQKGLTATTIEEAINLVKAHATDSTYNSIAVKISYPDFLTKNAALYSDFNNLLTTAADAGITVLPRLIGDDELVAVDSAKLANYIFTFINKYSSDTRIEGWNILQQSNETNQALALKELPYLMRRVRYAFPNQPLFLTPLVTSSTVLDKKGNDLANLMWRLSDISAYTASTSVGETWIKGLKDTFNRPLFCMNNNVLEAAFNAQHVNWYAASTSLTDKDVKVFDFVPDKDVASTDGSRWAGWRSWSWMNGKVTKGLSYDNINDALAKVNSLIGTNNPYNSIRVMFDLSDYYRKGYVSFMQKIDSLINTAEKAGMTVLPSLLQDKYFIYSQSMLQEYIKAVIDRYKNDTRIVAWELVFRPGSSFTNLNTLQSGIPQLFAVARALKPIQPLFGTPVVATQAFDAGYDYVAGLVHGKQGGWNRLTNFDINLTYSIWCLSDIISYSSRQASPELGWLNSVANKFGRPLFCSDWIPNSTESSDKVLNVFGNMHVNWYVNGSIDDASVKTFKYVPVSTAH